MAPINVLRLTGGPAPRILGWPSWPPPEELQLAFMAGSQFAPIPGRYVRESFSDLTDEQADHPNLARAADYCWEEA